MWIIDKKGNDQTLKMNSAQEELYRDICQRLLNEERCLYIILKSRQLGFTTFISALNTIFTLFQKNQSSVVIANTSDNASHIFRKYRHYYDKLKEHEPLLAPELKNQAGNIIYTKKNECSIRVAPSTENAVVGSTVQFLHLSECSRMPNLKVLLSAVLSSVPSVHDNPLTLVFLESTANGANEFKDLWDSSNETGHYIPKFYPWFIEESYRRKVPRDFILTPREKIIQAKYNLDLEQMAFYREKYYEYGKNETILKQEYPCCPSDAFATSGNGVFDNNIIGTRKDEVRNIKKEEVYFEYDTKAINNSITDFEVSNIKVIKSDMGFIKIFEEVQEGVPYVIGVDTAEGSGNDSSVAFVIRNDNKHQVAIMASNSMDIDSYTLQLYCLGIYYNEALIGIENNRSTTMTSLLKKCNYPNLYIRSNGEEMTYENNIQRYGVKTTSITKPIMKDIAVTICRDNNYKNIKDYGTLVEMESFVYEESLRSDAIKIKASGNKHDDRVMAMLITYYISSAQTTLHYHNKVENHKLPYALRTENSEVREEFTIW